MDQNMPGVRCKCPHHKIVPIVIVLIGLAFLLEAYAVLTPGFVAIAWPVLVIIAGLSKFFGAGCKCCAK